MPMWSFTAAMRELERTNSTNLPRVGDRPPRCFLPLPPGASTASNLPQCTHVYGFAVHEDFLANLAYAARPRARLDGVAATYAGLAIVRARTGATEAFLAAGQLPSPQAAHGISGQSESSARSTTGVVPLVGVCTSALGSYKRRPSQDVINRLVQTLGSTPRWWAVYVPKKGERVEDIVCAGLA